MRLTIVAAVLLLVTPQQRDPLSEPFRGITADGTVEAGLFPVRATGVSTAPVRQAAERFLRTLSPGQRGRTVFAADDIEWRRWNNVHRYQRQGIAFGEMHAGQREAAWALLDAALSARGVREARAVMRLNGYRADVLNNHEEYGDGLYYLTVMGTPSSGEPWGWQLDGHHLIVNYFVLGDQVVMTPTFVGSEPVRVDSGPYAGTAVLQEEQAAGEALMAALNPAQLAVAILDSAKRRNNALAQAFRDNLVLDYAGIRADALDARQRQLLLDLIAVYVGAMREPHARVRMDEVRAHLDRTFFAWIGSPEPGGVFYYRVHSPVILIEFDHQSPVALRGPRGVPTRTHVHSVVRTPNGNDYGKDLLRQHYERYRNDPAHGHQH